MRSLRLLVYSLVISGAALCSTGLAAQQFSEAIDKGVIDNDSINEASGIAASRRNANILWTHNDSGDEARVFAMTVDGHVVATYYLKSATNRDWEDICVGTGPKEGTSYLYIGEIGDNNAQYAQKYIYRIPEPAVDAQQNYISKQLDGVEKISYVYPDGQRDAEALMIDPKTKDLYVVSKREDSVRVYRLAYPQSTTQTITAEKVATLPLTSIVAADISSDGSEILLKNYQNIYYFKRAQNQTIAEALLKGGEFVSYGFEPQGEAVCFAANGEGYYTTSEETQFDIPAHVYFYSRQVSARREDDEEEEQQQAAIDAIYPNPSRSEFTIRFVVKEESTISVDLSDIRGNAITLIAARPYTSGRYAVTVPVSALSGGEYTVRLRAGSYATGKQFFVMK